MSKSSSPTTIAIIGGGLSGSLVATHLLRGATLPLDIKLIERRPLLGRGVAYGTDLDCHLLNVPAGKMSAFPDDPDHFLRWIQTHELLTINVKADTFVPRKIYGMYIQAVLDEAEAAASENVRLQRLTDEAVSIKADTKGAWIFLSSGETLHADRIVLALGNLTPSNPPVPNKSFYQSRRYIGSAWSAHALTCLSPDDPVLLIGSGMTALDLVLALQKQGHRGMIYVVSRHGLLPQAHQLTASYPLFLSAEPLPRTIRLLVRRVRQEVKSAIAQGQNWRAVIDSIRPLTQQLWQALPLEEQRRFLRHVRPYWEIHRHRVAPEVAKAVTSLLHSKQLAVHAGRIQAYQEDEQGVDVVLRVRHTTNQVLRVARVINCTGSECDYSQVQHRLIVNLRHAGLIRPDTLRLGLDVAPNGALLSSKGVASQFLYTLGSPRKGSLWETTAVAEIRVQAIALAEQLDGFD